MDTDISQCPENGNSTDCLLRTLLQLLKEYQEADNAAIDWDPISFAFTLLIGLVAILFALATVIQAIFAAGKGRRRTNHLAIGKWNVETKREWDWSEMNFRYTVSTPILHEESLKSLAEYNQVEHSPDKHATVKAAQRASRNFRAFFESIASCFHPNLHQLSGYQPSQSRRPSAAWLEFFKEVGLDELDVKSWGIYTRKVVADYLPDDITVAPAYAQVGAIVAAAVTAGIQKVEIEKQASRNYPILFGQGFQIDFRQHPGLGVVGAYSRYDKTSKDFRRLNVEELSSAMKTGRGFVDDQRTMDLSTESTRRQLIERWSRLGEAHAITCQSWSATFALNLSAISEAHLPLIIGMFADRPEHVPALLPTATMRQNSCLKTLALNGKYWAEVHLDEFKGSVTYSWVDHAEAPNWSGFIWLNDFVWENAMGSEAYVLYESLTIGRRATWNLWDRDILELFRCWDEEVAQQKAEERALREKAQAISGEAQPEVEPAAAEELQLREREALTRKEIKRRQAEKEGQAISSKAKVSVRFQERSARIMEEFGRRQGEKQGQATGPKAELTVDQATAEEARLKTQKIRRAEGEAQLRELDTELRLRGTKGEATIGHPFVLRTCLELLHEPALLEQRFSKASPDSMRFLRCLVHDQIKDVDEWLRDKEGIRHRSILLCNTTIVLLRVEQMIDNKLLNSLRPEEPQGHEMQGGSVEHQQTQSSNRGGLEQGNPSTIHFNTLQVLRNIVDGLHKKVRGACELENLLHRRSDSSLLWDRLKAIVVYQSQDEPGWQLWDQFKHEKFDKAARDIDDVIIYRCLMIVLLFRTAADSSKILESGIWDQVVPII